MKTMYVILASLLLAGSLSAQYVDQYEKWCPTVMAIYGVCSPELVANWLYHTQEVAASPPAMQVVNTPEATPTSNQNIPTPIMVPPVAKKPEPTVTPEPTQKVNAVPAFVPGKGLTIVFPIPEPEPVIWYATRIWMVS